MGVLSSLLLLRSGLVILMNQVVVYSDNDGVSGAEWRWVCVR